jgi:branched-subunit amino acid ABC-type transport system permease component
MDLRSDHERAQAQNESEAYESVWQAMVYATFVFMITMAIAINVYKYLSNDHTYERPLTALGCSAVVEEIDRLACFDEVVHHSAPQPSKGANAVELFRAH